jgi:phospho-2-dehydro-3-deoxyheptonate aldolase
MSSVRESVEWGYKDLKTIWKVCDWRNVLKLKNQPNAKIIFVCFLLNQKLVQKPEQIAALEYGKSVTDACLGWEDSVALLEELASAVRERRSA